MDAESGASQLVGAVFNGRWKLGRLVGEGGMGSVFEAHGTRGEGQRAIKVLHPEFTTEEQVLSRFFAEAQAARMLQHPNVAQIFDAQRAEDGTPYLVMEFLSGMPLSSFFHAGRPVPPAEAAPIMYGVLQALAVAHSRGVVHRDLKPDNLFLVPDGRGNHVVKVLDFGIAKVMDAAGGMGSKTKTGVLLGTPGYMSPEQIKNSKGVDARSDLWSVGIILYEMLSGHEAFPADNEFARLTLVLTQDITPIAQVAPQLASWSAFFARALSKDLAHRFQNANEMSQALMAMVGTGKSQSAQGREWNTVVLSMPQPPPGQQQGYAPVSQAQPYSSQQQNAFGQRQNLTPHGQGTASMQSAGMQPLSMQSAGMQPLSMQQQGYPSQQAPQQVSVHGIAPNRIDPNQVVIRPASVPPGPLNSGPSTHVSGQRPPGVPAPQHSNLEVPVVRAPSVGFPLWVIVAVGVACLVIGVAIGAVVF